MRRKKNGKAGISVKESAFLPQGWAESQEARNTDDLRKEIAQCSYVLAVNAKNMKEDDGLKSAVERVKEIKEPYIDTAKENKAKVAYVLQLLAERGAV